MRPGRSTLSTSGCRSRSRDRRSRSQRRRSSRLPGAGSIGSSAPSRSTGTQRYWPAIQLPRGRSRTIAPRPRGAGGCGSPRSPPPPSACRLRSGASCRGVGRRPRARSSTRRRGRREPRAPRRTPCRSMRVGVGDAVLGEEPLERPPLARGHRPCGRGADDGHELARHDEERAAHAEHPDERPLLVEGPLELCGLEAARPRPGREEHARGSVEWSATIERTASTTSSERAAGVRRCRATSLALRSSPPMRRMPGFYRPGTGPVRVRWGRPLGQAQVVHVQRLAAARAQRLGVSRRALEVARAADHGDLHGRGRVGHVERPA